MSSIQPDPLVVNPYIPWNWETDKTNKLDESLTWARKAVLHARQTACEKCATSLMVGKEGGVQEVGHIKLKDRTVKVDFWADGIFNSNIEKLQRNRQLFGAAKTAMVALILFTAIFATAVALSSSFLWLAGLALFGALTLVGAGYAGYLKIFQHQLLKAFGEQAVIEAQEFYTNGPGKRAEKHLAKLEVHAQEHFQGLVRAWFVKEFNKITKDSLLIEALIAEDPNLNDSLPKFKGTSSVTQEVYKFEFAEKLLLAVHRRFEAKDPVLNGKDISEPKYIIDDNAQMRNKLNMWKAFTSIADTVFIACKKENPNFAYEQVVNLFIGKAILNNQEVFTDPNVPLAKLVEQYVMDDANNFRSIADVGIADLRKVFSELKKQPSVKEIPIERSESVAPPQRPANFSLTNNDT